MSNTNDKQTFLKKEYPGVLGTIGGNSQTDDFSAKMQGDGAQEMDASGFDIPPSISSYVVKKSPTDPYAGKKQMDRYFAIPNSVVKHERPLEEQMAITQGYINRDLKNGIEARQLKIADIKKRWNERKEANEAKKILKEQKLENLNEAITAEIEKNPVSLQPFAAIVQVNANHTPALSPQALKEHLATQPVKEG